MRKFVRSWLPVAFAVLVAIAAMLPTGCNTSVKTSDENLEIIGYERLMELLADERSPVLLVDVRKPKSYAQGHIPGAVNIPVLQLKPNDPKLGEAQEIVVYSEGWTPLRTDRLSGAAAKKLLAMGYVGVNDFRGGLELWRNEGGQVVVQQPKNEEKAEAKTNASGG